MGGLSPFISWQKHKELHFFCISHQLDGSCTISPSFYTGMYWCCPRKGCFYLLPFLSHSFLALLPHLPMHTLAHGGRLKWMNWAHTTVFSLHQSPCWGYNIEDCPGMKMQPGYGMRLVTAETTGITFSHKIP